MYAMVFYSLLVAVVVFGLLKLIKLHTTMNHVPGPKGYPFLGVLPYITIQNFHKQLEGWSTIHGPVMRLHLIHKVRLVVSDFDSIYQVLVTKAKECGGRPHAPRAELLLQETGILLSTKPDKTWKGLRKASHKHLKQFGEGMTHLENIITDVAEDMFDEFADNVGKPFDPYQVIFDTALNSIAFLITGKRCHTGDDLVEKMRRFETLCPKYILSTEPKYIIYDVIPSLRHLNLPGWSDIKSILDLECEIWKDVQVICKDDPEARSLVTTLMDHVTANNSDDATYAEVDVRKTTLSLLFAGVTTTSASFYAGVNILAHHPAVQELIHKEIVHVAGSTAISLVHRPEMPYTNAVLLELLRYVSVVPMGIPHYTMQDVNINGHNIPKDTNILTNLWALHHDKVFWKDPFNFCPERFLDKDGKLVPADHPNRKHLMPFGAGMRVCLGESLALARLFLWIITLVQRYKVVPAKNNLKSATDPRNFELEAVLRVTRYSVIFHFR